MAYNVSIDWLNDHLNLGDKSIEEMADLLTFAGIEVEAIDFMPDKVVVAQVDSSEKHPDADKLSVCMVNDGTGNPRQIVCGAKNYQMGDKVPLALPGCKLTSKDGKAFEIKPGKLRGVESHGMLCSGAELGRDDGVDGLWILPEDLAPGTPLTEVFGAVYELEVTPNRPDLLSHLGVARELAVLLEEKVKGPVALLKSKTPQRPAKESEVKISDTETCPLYTARIIRGVKVGPSPEWLQAKLTSIGLRPINNVVDITNYVIMEMGQPLHAFDMAHLDGGIHVRRAQAGEEFLALNGESYELDPTDCVIADSKTPHALGGVMGGENSGVTEETVDVLLEAAYFTPRFIRKTSQRHTLHSDSSYRFERGVDPQQVIGASDLATKLIKELAGGKPDEELLVAGEAPVEEIVVPLDNAACCQLIGQEIPAAEIAGILKRLGLKKTKEGWAIPSYRLDLHRQVDLIEEVARVYGLDRVPGKRHGEFVLQSKTDVEYDFRAKLRSHLSALGFYECQTMKLISEKESQDVLGSVMPNMKPVRVKNPMTDTHSVLRPGLLPALLRVAKHNVNSAGVASLRFFEIGTVFFATPKGDEIEQSHLALVMSGLREDVSWQQTKPDTIDFHGIRAVLESMLGQPVTLSPAKDENLVLAAEVRVGKVKAGIVGQLWPARARHLDVDGPVIVGELNLKKLSGLVSSLPRYSEVPRYPAITRDVAVEAPQSLSNQEIMDLLGAVNEPLLEKYELFDVFMDPTGEKLPADKKSLAYSLTYRHVERTMESSEVDAAHAKILDEMKRKLGVEFR